MPDLRPLSDDARAIHARYPVIDLHADTLLWGRWLGYDVLARHTPPLPLAAFGGHVDVPRMRDGGMGAQCFGLVTLPVADRGLVRMIDEQIDVLDQAVARDPSALRLVRTGDDILAAERDGAVAALLGMEGAHSLEGDLSHVARLARRGLRSMGLVHFSANQAGFPAYGWGRKDQAGLTRWGFELIEHCEANGVLVDLAHLNRAGALDACRVAKRPPYVSHTGVLGAFDHWRNIDDNQLRAVAEKGGCVGVIFAPRFLGGDGLEPVIRHLRHILDVVGEDVPALGSDWDGMIVPTKPLRDPRGLPLLTEAMIGAGMSERVIGKILRGNALRLFNDA